MFALCILHTFTAWNGTKARIEAICDAIRIPGDTMAIGLACSAIDEDRAAFWCTTTFSNTASARAVNHANISGDLTDALELVGISTGGYLTWGVYQQLEVLIPLNHQAAEQMVELYGQRGHKRTVEDLLSRETMAVVYGRSLRAA
jgi:hypothetical protein